MLAQDNIELLGFKLTRTVISPRYTKTQEKTERLRPAKLKQLCSFLGALNAFNKCFTTSAVLSFPFKKALKKYAERIWEEEHEKAYYKNNNEVKRVAELSHFRRNYETRKSCDASKRGLVAVSQQRQRDGEWGHIGFASRYLTDFEVKFSINELELLAIVWTTGHFENYVYGILFKVASDH